MANSDSSALREPVLEIRNLWKRFGENVALRDVDLTINKGDFLTLLGPSGSGKTTLLMAMAGFVTPSEGSILLRGRDLVPLEPEERNLGVVFQGYALFPKMSVAQNVAFPLELRGWKGARLRDQVQRTLDLVELGHLADRKPSQLSGGQQQRVALARCLVFEPEIVLLDEPLSALDRELRIKLQEELKALHRQVGVTFVNVTHDQDEALSMSTHIAVIDHGEIVQYGRPREIYDTPSTEFVARFIGRSNVLSIDEVETKANGPSARVGTLSIPIPNGDTANTAPTALSLRPEVIEILAPDPASDNADAEGDTITIRAEVSDLTYQGSLTTLLTRTAAGPIRVECPTGRLDPDLTIGSEIALRWARNNVRAL
ncbi:ABC transporter ATP-binding protein [Rhodobacteraceae bacterium NNCM2]|nr:ABC transporter ATP-binding protein [Coraliihabitans acroporae]